MKNKKINELSVWRDMFLNPGDHIKAFGYALVSFGCFVGIVAIRLMV